MWLQGGVQNNLRILNSLTHSCKLPVVIQGNRGTGSGISMWASGGGAFFSPPPQACVLIIHLDLPPSGCRDSSVTFPDQPVGTQVRPLERYQGQESSRWRKVGAHAVCQRLMVGSACHPASEESREEGSLPGASAAVRVCDDSQWAAPSHCHLVLSDYLTWSDFMCGFSCFPFSALDFFGGFGNLGLQTHFERKLFGFVLCLCSPPPSPTLFSSWVSQAPIPTLFHSGSLCGSCSAVTLGVTIWSHTRGRSARPLVYKLCVLSPENTLTVIRGEGLEGVKRWKRIKK